MSLFRHLSNKDKGTDRERAHRHSTSIGRTGEIGHSTLREVTNAGFTDKISRSANINPAPRRSSMFGGLTRQNNSRQPIRRSSNLNIRGLATSSTLPSVVERTTNVQPARQPLRILIAPTGFKDIISAKDIADCIEEGIRRAVDSDDVILKKIPLYDVESGLSRAFIDLNGATVTNVVVGGLCGGQSVNAHFATFSEGKEKTGVVDVGSAAGAHLIDKDGRDITKITSLGVGQVMNKAIEQGCRKLIVDCGDSVTCDGGAGMLQGLGFRFGRKNAEGQMVEMPKGITGETLGDVVIMADNRDPGQRIYSAEEAVRQRAPLRVEAACDMNTFLTGPRGCATVYGAQRGASISKLEKSFAAYIKTASSCLHNGKTARIQGIGMTPGSGASGGIGAGLIIAGATLRDRSAIMDEHFGITKVVDEDWDIVIIAEKEVEVCCETERMSGEIARRASKRGAKVVALGSRVPGNLGEVYGAGVAAVVSIMDGPRSTEEVEEHVCMLISGGAERAMRLLEVGRSLQK